MSSSRHPSELINFRRKPKVERKSPVYEFQHDYTTYEEAMLNVGLSNSQGFSKLTATEYVRPVIQDIIREKIAIHEGEKSVTLTSSRHVVRWNREAKKPYSTWETLAVRTIFLTSRDNIHFYNYNIEITQTGQRTRRGISVFDSDYLLGSLGLGYGFPKHDAFPAMGRPPLIMLRAYAEQKFGRSVALDKVYPMREIIGPVGNILLPSDAMRSDNAADFTRSVFGKRCYRKDLVRAVGFILNHKSQYGKEFRSRNAQKLYWLSLFKGHVPTDWIVAALNDPYVGAPERTEASQVAPLSVSQRKEFKVVLDRLKPAERRNLMINPGGWYEVTDMLRAFTMPYSVDDLIPARRDNYKGIVDLHDRAYALRRQLIARDRRKADAERYKAEHMWVNKDDKGKQLADRLEFPVPLDVPFRIKIARDYDTVAIWGDIMNNCIGGYFSQPDTILGGIYEGNELMANFEIKRTQVGFDERDVAYAVVDPVVGPIRLNEEIMPTSIGGTKTITRRETVPIYAFELRQLLGKYNASLDKDYRAKVEEFLGALGVKMATGRWV